MEGRLIFTQDSTFSTITNYLGLNILDQFVSFNIKVNMLRRISFLPKSMLETLYFRAVIPSVLHEVVVWGSGHKCNKLELIHIGAARLISRLPNGRTDDDLIVSVG